MSLSGSGVRAELKDQRRLREAALASGDRGWASSILT